MMTAVLNSSQEDDFQPVDMDLTCAVSPGETSVQQMETSGDADKHQMMRVYLRIRPFSKKEFSDNEDQDCVIIDDDQTVTLKAPKGSATMKSSKKGIGTSIHKFSFSKIFGPETTQAELFEATVRDQVLDFLDGGNALIFSYGVTNTGKTFTIQGRQYEEMDLKPFLRNGVQHLDVDQVKLEKTNKTAVFASIRDECDRPKTTNCSETSSETSSDSTGLLPPSCCPTVLTSNAPEPPSTDLFALWVGFFEIYNESVYDLLQPSKKRSSLRVCDDCAGNVYIKDLRWINVQNLSEAWKLVQVGNKNRSAASTRMNQSSSRSHGIFTMKLLKVEVGAVKTVSEFSLCDLAGSERCNKTKTYGERLKEAGNINNSLLILGKCISALRCSQTDRMRKIYVPFRESKLTKLFQAYFCGSGRASMIVNINQCSSTYDETLHAMKFSALAKQVVQVIPDRPPDLPPCLFGQDGKPLLRNSEIDNQVLESFLSAEEEEADITLLPQAELLSIVENLKTKLLAERRKNLVQEVEIRKEMGDAMLQQLMESEELRMRQIEELKESHAEKLEKTFELYKDAIKDYAYQCALSSLEDDYVPLDQFTAEQNKVEALRREVSVLEMLVSSRQGQAPTADQSCQTELSKDAEEAEKERWERLYREKCAVEKMCEDKQQIIVSLDRRLMELSRTLEDIRNSFLDKSAELEKLQRKADEQLESMEEILWQNADKDREISSLKDQISKLSKKSPVKSRTRRWPISGKR
ncbi:kinesin-like protein KIF20A isoform X2 [Melanotaenia boesemani]|uniref:kinesin-like protein KIF20A isoform X2 n=1 Tax=Melanotaenia boesemani TaxID=1250792 RepID=UPI001C045DB8|nr:kinesin-like protein KIF20A isoform X2 [Melanotaenia boesemani]